MWLFDQESRKFYALGAGVCLISHASAASWQVVCPCNDGVAGWRVGVMLLGRACRTNECTRDRPAP